MSRAHLSVRDAAFARQVGLWARLDGSSGPPPASRGRCGLVPSDRVQRAAGLLSDSAFSKPAMSCSHRGGLHSPSWAWVAKASVGAPRGPNLSVGPSLRVARARAQTETSPRNSAQVAGERAAAARGSGSAGASTPLCALHASRASRPPCASRWPGWLLRFGVRSSALRASASCLRRPSGRSRRAAASSSCR